MPGVSTLSTRQSEIDTPNIGEGPGYYKISLLQAPVWKWEIAIYFFLGGLSAGAYVLGRAAERLGGPIYRTLAKLSSFISLAAILPCPPLLIRDLGDPKRFHHMLRVFKPSTPMNLGTYLLSGFSFAATGEVFRHLFIAGRRGRIFRTLDGVMMLLHDVFGVPLAFGVAGYTGVLLSCASTPLWCRNGWIGPLFSASAFANGASVLNLSMDVMNVPEHHPAKRAIETVDTAAHITEAAMLAGYMAKAGPLAKPFTHGKMKPWFWTAVLGLLGGEALKLVPASGNRKRALNITAALVGLTGGFALRWAFVYGGQESGNDPRSARLSSRKVDSHST